MTLVKIKGENGSGKSLIMTMCALAVPDKDVKANYYIKHPRYSPLELEDFLHIDKNTDVFIDEAYTWLENRRSSSAINVFISEIKEQKRKTNSTWYVSEQRPNLIDKRFNEYPNVVIECKTRYPIGTSVDDFVYKITFDNPYQVVYKILPYQVAKQYFEYFNTNEIVETHNADKIEFEFIKNNSAKLLKKVIELSKVIEKDKETIYTHDGLKYACMKHGILLDYKPLLYLYFKQKRQREKEKKK